MSVRTVSFADSFRPDRWGAPYYAYETPLPGTGPYRAVDFVEFMLIVSGEGRRAAHAPDGTLTSLPLVPGQLHLFSPNDTHELYSLSTPTMEMLDVAFPTSTWEKFVDAAELDRSWASLPTSLMVVVDADDPEVALPFRTMAERFRDGPDVLDLIQFLAAMVPYFVPPEPVGITGGPPWLREVLQAMTSEHELRRGVSRLIELSRVNPAHLWRTMRRYTGLAPREFVLTVQMRHAAWLLMTTDETVAAISERCGFSSTSHFSQMFRRIHGRVPRDHRAHGLSDYK